MAEDRTNEILSAITTLAERLQAIEKSIGVMDRKLNAVARKLLAPTEIIALGIAEPRTGGSTGEESGYPMAAKPRE